MAIVKCGKGHFYDDQKYGSCPFCKKEQPERAGLRGQETVAAYKAGAGTGEDRETVWLSYAGTGGNREDARTVGIYSPFRGNDFVTGWLVCTKGEERGRDFRLHYGFNRIGRGLLMDVCILGDEQISRNSHCSVVYEHRKNEFSLVPENGCLTYFKGEALQEPVKLHSGDRFVIGDTELVFIAFCGEGIRWEEES